MFTLPSSVQVYLCPLPTDMRKSFDSLAAMAVQEIRQNPLSGHLFVFFNRPRNRVKILFWDRTGYCLYYKRLEAGTFSVPVDGDSGFVISLPALTLILEGIDLAGARKRKRFSLSA
jgi:transposase